ncbi:Uncharacterised protein [Lederbergia lenta]|uniref:Uncharacterized protein n=1 Tax=Lederbergia lenta TaxID=1467 RepID=A0A2X4W1J3_LEDLE|nr:Uncharacterised protein [Lederbergia lenta]
MEADRVGAFETKYDAENYPEKYLNCLGGFGIENAT